MGRMRCEICGKPFLYRQGDDEWPLVVAVLGLFPLTIGAFTTDVPVIVSIGGALVTGWGIYKFWSIRKGMKSGVYCDARPGYGDPCLEAYKLRNKKGMDQYFAKINYTNAQARYNQRLAWEKRGEDPGWERFEEEYPGFREKPQK